MIIIIDLDFLLLFYVCINEYFDHDIASPFYGISSTIRSGT